MKKVYNHEIASLEDANYHVKTNDLLTDIRLAIGDVFNAKVEEMDDNLTLVFTNGQKFCLFLKEMVNINNKQFY
ncbi:MAG: hypothetical protein J1F36_02840 [Clostridiales bacterium]|nr:hypothetical protein [Clostridiales bacterium]